MNTPQPTEEEMRKAALRLINDVTVYGGVDERTFERDVEAVARYVLDRLGEQGELTEEEHAIIGYNLNILSIKGFANNAEALREVINKLKRMAVTTSPSKAGEPQGWQPISSAPKDGTPVDLWIDRPPMCGGVIAARSYRVPDAWFANDNWVKPGLSHFVDWDHATHWMPLPNSPEKAGDE